MTKLCKSVLGLVLCLFSLSIPLVSSARTLNLTLIHNNDFHTRYLPFKWSTYTECDPHKPQFRSEACVGGLARTVFMVSISFFMIKYNCLCCAQMKQLRKTIPNVLFLNAGDHFQGTFWYTMLKSEVVAELVGLMRHDTMALGNHEFDDGNDELRKFINLIKQNEAARNMSILSCNLIVDNDPLLNGMIDKSTVRVVGNVKVAIIGYTTPETVFLSKPGKNVQFIDEIVAIKAEIKRLKSQHPDLNIFIAVGHSGFEKDVQLAKAIPDLDVVIGGHSNTFLYTGRQLPSIEQPEGDYPLVVEHTVTKQKTLVLEAFAYGKYLGKLDTVFDANGHIVSYAGQPIYLNTSVPQGK